MPDTAQVSLRVTVTAEMSSPGDKMRPTPPISRISFAVLFASTPSSELSPGNKMSPVS